MVRHKTRILSLGVWYLHISSDTACTKPVITGRALYNGSDRRVQETLFKTRDILVRSTGMCTDPNHEMLPWLSSHLHMLQPVSGLQAGQPVRLLHVGVDDVLELLQRLPHDMDVLDVQEDELCVLVLVTFIAPSSGLKVR